VRAFGSSAAQKKLLSPSLDVNNTEGSPPIVFILPLYGVAFTIDNKKF
jgi:hypothetical protein